MRLFTYKMTHDTGFAPNPFHGVLTLATCKPGIRRTKKPQDWVAGFSSKSLRSNSIPYGVDIADDALLWVGRVSEVLPINQYFEENRFVEKIPDVNSGDPIKCVGDNIYKPLSSGDFEQLESEHGENLKNHDLGGKNVLVFNEFYYMGRAGRPLPSEIQIHNPRVHDRGAPAGNKTGDDHQIKKLIAWVKGQYRQCGLIDMPCMLNVDRVEYPDSSGSCGS